MESKANYALVGIAVVILTLGILSAVLWLAGGGAREEMKTYTVYFREQSLEGLQTDSYVTMKGIRVGKVTSFKISPSNIERVEVTLRVDEDTPIKQDTRAVIRRNLLTGLAAIDLVGSSQQSPPLTAVPNSEEHPVIPEGVSEFRVFADTVPNLLENSGELMERVKAVFSEENRSSITATLRHVEQVSGAIARNDEKIDRMINDAAQVAASMRKVSASLEKAVGDERLPRITEDIAEVLEGLRAVVAEARETLGGLSGAFRGAAGAIAEQISTLSGNFARVAESFSAAAERFEEPSALLSGPSPQVLGPGERAPLTK